MVTKGRQRQSRWLWWENRIHSRVKRSKGRDIAYYVLVHHDEEAEYSAMIAFATHISSSHNDRMFPSNDFVCEFSAFAEANISIAVRPS